MAALFVAILVLYTPAKVKSVLVLLVIFGALFISLVLYR